ncbi:gliding motility-associated C-terminal domain-containing protein [Maribacter sp. BPC-D8]|uniref:gliding motility-associated C-terminal domain-containing protein n=1 Tax=Maribacter sp. BPC-D8 TaxID=3053613 RepID=UPI002B4AA931|nr:gliding motility-associated C-terminal domain-containing protein [Maribacter sp. BPC-D8]WRI28412.1 gliding motility-associated C-terminal domain-containing protein [Maribacter sp. BPC-D8]
MRKVILLIIFIGVVTQKSEAQNIRNFGDLRIHHSGQMGFFSSLENDGLFNNSKGLVGFYGNYQNIISGSISPNFYDFEINSDKGIFLQMPISVSNNTNFVYGNISTLKTDNSNFLELISTSFYNGETNFSKVNGFISISDIPNFLFPIGDEFYLRPLGIDTQSTNTSYKSAYHFENATQIYSNNIQKNTNLLFVNENEYWVLEGKSPTLITIGWNERSELRNFTDDISKITIVGFDKELKLWIDMSTVERTGDLEEGFITSKEFNPDDFSALTFGILKNNSPISHKGYHYLVSPNGDGINDFLFIPELSDFEYNHLQIFDRNGLKVFEQENYTNEFDGEAGSNLLAIKKKNGLPQGIYYYLITVGDKNLTIQGFLYLDR